MTYVKTRSSQTKSNPTSPEAKVKPINQPTNQLTALNRFREIAKRDLAFHSTFLAIGAIALVGFIFFFSFLADSFLMGIFVAFFFFAFVLYFVLRLYFQEQKPAEFAAICNQYQSELADFIGKDNPLKLSDALTSFANSLDNSEVSFYTLPKQLETFRPYFEQLWRACHWKDVHYFKELFLKAAVQEKTKLVKCVPLDAQAHVELANSYLAQANHFKAPIIAKFSLLSQSRQAALLENFRLYVNLAIEEYHIVKELTPNESWVHKQLAICYQAQDMPEKEIEEYEAITKLSPQDHQSLLALGRLYFRLGLNGKGLKVYEKLRKLSPQSAEVLIDHYGSIESL